MGEKLKKIQDFEDSIKASKAEELKRGRDDMLKWTQKAKKVLLTYFNYLIAKRLGS